MTRAGIIAAGEGSRLRAAHPGTVKPLVPVAGRPLSHWIVSSLSAAGVDRVTLLHNSGGRAVRESLRAAFPSLSIDFLEADTASSWESFRLVARTLSASGEPFIISTVDALVPPQELKRFRQDCEARRPAAALALTDFVDDEKPLWADLDQDGRVTALGEKASRRKWVTSGLYYLDPQTAAAMPEAGRFTKLRDYLSWLAESAAVLGVPLAKTLDVDRAEDVAHAEAFITW